ncbi:MAG: 3-hydroxyacyl-CoA dehydrogenase family protein [Caulobacteraceae bacterium]
MRKEQRDDPGSGGPHRRRDRGGRHGNRNQEAMVQAGLLDGAVAQDARALIHATTDLAEAVRGCQFVSESVPEDPAQKQAVFAALDREAPPDAIFSTDTSGLSVSAIAAATTRPEVVVGFHWMNPAHLMPPVEVSGGPKELDRKQRSLSEALRGSRYAASRWDSSAK